VIAPARATRPASDPPPLPAVTRREGNLLRLDGAVTIQTAAGVLAEAVAQIRDGVDVVDFGGVSEVDSSAVALAMALLREARSAGRTIAFANLTPAIVNLATLYAVADFMPVAPR
jgi:phospholipid transport system transporter-binding protein